MRICLYTMVHLNSRRVPQKVMQRVRGVPLCIQTFQLMNAVSRLEGIPAFVMANRDEFPLALYAEDENLTVLPLDFESANSADPKVIYKDVLPSWKKDYDFVIYVGSTAPFLTVETVQRSVNFTREHPNRMWIGAKEIPKPRIWNAEKREVIKDEILDTYTAERWYIQTCVLSGWLPGNITDEVFPQELLPFVFPEEEHLDVDTPFDLELVQSLAAYRSLSQKGYSLTRNRTAQPSV